MIDGKNRVWFLMRILLNFGFFKNKYDISLKCMFTSSLYIVFYKYILKLYTHFGKFRKKHIFKEKVQKLKPLHFIFLIMFI